MMNDEKKPIEISIDKIFTDEDVYIIPLYQRSYAWEREQIEKLIEDIADSIKYDNDNYYLGTLITNKKETGEYEVIDGQQRLITLYLLKLYLSEKEGLKPKEKSLQFEAREKYHYMLSRIRNNNDLDDNNNELSSGYKDIKRYFEEKIDYKCFKEKLKKVSLVRVQVPKNIDLNHYFEIMNTRGEQLEPHHIAKAKILECLETDKDKAIAARIWDCCADMDSYIQMNFDKNIREKLFSYNWTYLAETINDWDSLTAAFTDDNNKQPLSKNKSLIDILDSNDKESEKIVKNTDETYKKERFKSIISFPDFLLQVNAVLNDKEYNKDDNDEDISLDDKRLIDILEKNWKNGKDEENKKENKKNAEIFILTMLRCRALFDKYIIKREYAGNYQDRGKWSLKRLEKDNNSASYKSTYYNSKEDSEDGDDDTKILRTLQSALRITYTSPKSMRWITIILKALLKNKDEDLKDLLEGYCCHKVRKSDYQNAKGFAIKRIVFSYLDYLLYRDGYKDIIKKLGNWEFQFRNSIEHFHPQNPNNDKYKWANDDLHSFGNLALITVSGNSQFSNLPPEDKIVIDKYKDIIKQSLKLCIMKEMTKNKNKWTPELAEEHKKDMIKILNDDIYYKKRLIIN